MKSLSNPEWVEPATNPNPPDAEPMLWGPRRRLQRRKGVVLLRFGVAVVLFAGMVSWVWLERRAIEISVLGLKLYFVGPLRVFFGLSILGLYLTVGYLLHPNLGYASFTGMPNEEAGCVFEIVRDLLIMGVVLWPARFVMESVGDLLVLLRRPKTERPDTAPYKHRDMSADGR